MYNAPPNSEIYYQLAQLVSPSVALPAELVKIVLGQIKESSLQQKLDSTCHQLWALVLYFCELLQNF